MTFYGVIILLAAGFFGGLANSIAGGASLFTFPALLAVGLNPIVANASNAFALLPGNVLGAYGDRAKLPKPDYWFFEGLFVVLIGGGIGALALLVTPQQLFSALVPALIGLASLIFAFSKSIQNFMAHCEYRAGEKQRQTGSGKRHGLCPITISINDRHQNSDDNNSGAHN